MPASNPRPTQAPAGGAGRPSTPPPSPGGKPRVEQEAALLEDRIAPLGLRAVLGFGDDLLSLEGVEAYMRKITRGISDPVELMMLQQYTVAHHRLLQLHGQAANAQDNEAVKVFNAAAARLQGELRRLALAIRQYRAPVSTKTFTVVEQQNVASKQEVTYVAQAADHKKLHSRDIEQGSNADGRDHAQEPEPRARWLREQEALEGAHTGWA